AVLVGAGFKPAPIASADDVLAARIVAAMEAAGHRVDRGAGGLNIVYVEGLDPDGGANDNAPHRLHDLRRVIGFTPDRAAVGAVFNPAPKILGKWEATTEPGRYWTEHPMHPKGAARIAFGQYRAWQVGYHHGDPGHEALVQTGGAVTVC